MKKTFIKPILLAAATMIAFAGCGKAGTEVNDPGEPDAQKEPIVVSEPAKDPDDDIVDDMSITAEDGKELIIMRVKDDYIELTNNCEPVYCQGEAAFPEMSDGSVIRMVADADIYMGGEVGFMNNAFIKNVIETEPLDYAETASKLDIPNLMDNDFEYGQYVLQYRIDDDIYFALLYAGDIILYQNGEPVFEYEYSVNSDVMEPLYAYLSTGVYDPPTPDVPQVMPELSEEEIRDMDDIHLRGYGDLLAEGCLIDVATQNDLRKDYNLSKEDGYIGIGRYAGESAETEAEALEIAKAFWVGSSFITYDNIKLIDEGADFWLYQADYSMNGEFKAIDTLIVYKKDYYDAKLKKVGFELTDESIRRFFATQYMEPTEKTCCIGEFVGDDSEGFYYRRYDLQLTKDENYSDKNIIQVFETEYNISPDGQITQADHFEPLHEMALTVGTVGISEEQAVTAVREYCYSVNTDLKSIEEAGEYPVYWEIESSDEKEIVVLFRSYTGALIRYYIDRATGDTSITEFMPGITDEEEPTGESFNIWDYVTE